MTETLTPDERHRLRLRALLGYVPAEGTPPEGGYDEDECFVCGTPVADSPLCQRGHTN